MNPEVKKKWLEALRSGKYRQATEQLRKGDAYCCLGVLCDLYAKEHPEAGFTADDAHRYVFKSAGDDNYVFSSPGDRDSEDLPTYSVMVWAGIDNWNIPQDLAPEMSDNYRLPAGSVSLPAINDDGNSFEVIADVIEKAL